MYIVSWWQNPLFDGCWTITFGVLFFAKVSFRLLACILLFSLLGNLGVVSSLRFCLFVRCFMLTKSILWCLLTHRFWSPVFCEGQLSLVSMSAPDLNGNESRSYFIVELLSLSTLFQGGEIISLIVTDPWFYEFCLLRSTAFACCHLYSRFHR